MDIFTYQSVPGKVTNIAKINLVWNISEIFDLEK